MDCVRAQEIISAAIDEPETANSPAFVAARSHAATCPSCRAFAQAATSLWAAPAPKAPDGLAERILGAVSAEAETKAGLEAAKAAREQATAAAATIEPPAVGTVAGASAEPANVLPFPTPAARPRRRFTQTQNRLVWAGGVAAVLLVAFGVARLGLSTMRPGGSGTQLAQAPQEAAAPSSANSIVTTAPDTEMDGATRSSKAAPNPSFDSMAGGATTASTPAYVTLGTRVFEQQAELQAVPSGATSAGWVFTSRGSDTPSNLRARTSKDSSQLYLETTSTVVQYRAVTRLFAGKRFVLVSQRPLERYGQWPGLPDRFPTPTSSDGSPTFQPSMLDDSGRQTYVPQGEQPATGFALAPDPSSSGNPNWTWWEPMP